jgi:dipeptidyl aminopeptidase/acylaminoacyl peptidase
LGFPFALSPDTRHAIWAPPVAPDVAQYLEIISTGAGAPQRLPGKGLTYTMARWLPDGRRIVAMASASGSRARLYLVEPGAGGPRPISPEGIVMWAVSPDGSTIAAAGPDAGICLYPVDGSAPRDVPGLTDKATPVGWTTDGLLVMGGTDRARGDIHKADLRTGRRELWTNILPRDPAGILVLGPIVVTPDGRGLTYLWTRALSNLYVAAGLA